MDIICISVYFGIIKLLYIASMPFLIAKCATFVQKREVEQMIYREHMDDGWCLCSH